MAFLLTIQTNSITDGGNLLSINDSSIWADAAFPRSSFGVFLHGEFRMSSSPEPVALLSYDPLTVDEWAAEIPFNGRYSFKAYAFVVKDTVAPSVDDVAVDNVDGKLYKWTGATWVETTLEESFSKAYYSSTEVDIPLLTPAYLYRNELNLEYIKAVKKEIDKGAAQNKLFYKRTSLDYVESLITGAEYNWSLNNYANFYEIVLNLNEIISTGKLS